MASQMRLAMTVVWCALTLAACGRVHEVGSGASAGAAAGARAAPGERVASVGTKAIAKLEPVPGAMSAAQPSDPAATAAAMRPVMGTATFAQRQAGVNLAISIVGCVIHKTYSAFILEGTDCGESMLLSAHWDAARGEGISDVMCTGAGGGGRGYYSRASTDPKPWTIGGPTASDIVGHVVVLYASDMPGQPIACGTITPGEEAPSIDAGASDAHVPPVDIRAQLAGLCVAKMIVRSNTQDCPDPAEFQACVEANCDTSVCLQKCSSYAACLEAAPEACDLSCESAIEKPCADCTGELQTCAFGFCTDQFACAAPPMPGGPCSKLEACCGMQGDSAASCLDTVHLVEKISGDPSCVGIMSDWDFTSHLAVPCNFQ